MKHFLKYFLSLFLSAVPSFAYTDTFTLSGNPPTLTINSANAGSQPNNATNSSTTYSLSTTNSVTKITGRINSNMATGLTLRVSLAAPTGATSAGAVTMNTSAKNLVTGIPRNTISSGRTITYTLSATVSATKVTNQTKTLTLTLQ